MALNFSIEKILNITPTEYCASVGKKLEDYRLVGVHTQAELKEELLQKFVEAIPKDAEVVVNYQPQYVIALAKESFFSIRACGLQIAEGTALIPKKI